MSCNVMKKYLMFFFYLNIAFFLSDLIRPIRYNKYTCESSAPENKV